MSNGRLFSIRSKLAISLVNQITYVMAQEDNKVEMEILCKWNGCLPFTWKTRKFQLENQMVRITRFGVLLKLLASGQSDAFLFSTPFGIYS